MLSRKSIKIFPDSSAHLCMDEKVQLFLLDVRPSVKLQTQTTRRVESFFYRSSHVNVLVIQKRSTEMLTSR